MNATTRRTPGSGRRRRPGSDDVRVAILEAAGVEFSEHGFDGASTRRIADRASVFQAQIGYHVGTKDDLWRATLDHLFTRLRSHLDAAVADDPDRATVDPVTAFADVIRRHVEHTARCPELSRIMLMESARATERVEWLLNQHVRPTLAALELVWADVRAAGRGRDIPAAEVFMMMIGLAPMPFAQAGIMRSVLGAERCTAERHAEVMIEWILG